MSSLAVMSISREDDFAGGEAWVSSFTKVAAAISSPHLIKLADRPSWASSEPHHDEKLAELLASTEEVASTLDSLAAAADHGRALAADVRNRAGTPNAVLDRSCEIREMVENALRVNDVSTAKAQRGLTVAASLPPEAQNRVSEVLQRVIDGLKALREAFEAIHAAIEFSADASIDPSEMSLSFDEMLSSRYGDRSSRMASLIDRLNDGSKLSVDGLRKLSRRKSN
ncbi:hypothetical protein [Pseudomonas sp. CGJS7]|uniref:hypothetical protein n=1 Tax=Pseudomonas sp. CGJS7 TaxID=3109348 RepID=UPI003009C990